LNRFAYAGNSPTNLIDPTGYAEEEPSTGQKTLDVLIGVWQQWTNNIGYEAWTNDYACERIGCAAGESYSPQAAGMPLYQPYPGPAENSEVELGRDLEPAVMLLPALLMRNPRVAANGAEAEAAAWASGGRLGNQATRTHVAQVADEMESRGWTITRGGGRFPEEYLPGPNGARKGSSYPDITATKNDRTLRVNTIDTLSNGVTPSKREATNAARIRSQTSEHVLLVPKPK
jgi:hypothetical protein